MQSNIEIASSSYNVNDGKLTLGFEKPTKEFELSSNNDIDKNSNSFNGDEQNDNILKRCLYP